MLIVLIASLEQFQFLFIFVGILYCTAAAESGEHRVLRQYKRDTFFHCGTIEIFHHLERLNCYGTTANTREGNRKKFRTIGT